MNSRFLRWMVLGFTCLWFGMLVPVHQRGQIQLPGPALAASGGCCPKQNDAKAACRDTETSKNEKPAPDPGHCAVCHFIAGLQAPPPVTIYVACLGLTRILPVDHVCVVPLRHAALPFHGLDPPAL